MSRTSFTPRSKSSFWAWIIAWAFAAPIAADSPPSEAPATNEGYRLVVHAANPIRALSRRDLSRIFLNQRRNWDWDGPALAQVAPYLSGSALDQPRRIQVFDQEAESPTRVAFSRDVLCREAEAILRFWQRHIFSCGPGSVPPEVVASDLEVLARVAADPRAIGYVSLAAPDHPDVRELKIEGSPCPKARRSEDR